MFHVYYYPIAEKQADCFQRQMGIIKFMDEQKFGLIAILSLKCHLRHKGLDLRIILEYRLIFGTRQWTFQGSIKVDNVLTG
jgi:hypothetical protein